MSRNVYITAMESTISKNRYNLIISGIFVVTGIFVGLLLTMQFKSSMPTALFPADELQAQRELIESYVSDQGLLKSKIVSLRSQTEEAQENAKAIVQVANLEILKTLKKDMGLELLRGPGVQIDVNDGVFVNRDSADEVSQSMIHASDLRDIVNILRTAKVEGIAINDQRILSSTPITSVGNTILVNNFHLLPPFTITAIGDADLIMQRINDPSSLPDLQKRASELKIQFSSEQKDGLSAPIYNGNLSTKFVKEYTDIQP